MGTTADDQGADDEGSEALDAPDAGPAAASQPGPPADTGEPVLDPDAEGDDPERAARAGVERLERHNRGRAGDQPSQ